MIHAIVNKTTNYVRGYWIFDFISGIRWSKRTDVQQKYPKWMVQLSFADGIAQDMEEIYLHFLIFPAITISSRP